MLESGVWTLEQEGAGKAMVEFGMAVELHVCAAGVNLSRKTGKHSDALP